MSNSSQNHGKCQSFGKQAQTQRSWEASALGHITKAAWLGRPYKYQGHNAATAGGGVKPTGPCFFVTLRLDTMFWVGWDGLAG